MMLGLVKHTVSPRLSAAMQLMLVGSIVASLLAPLAYAQNAVSNVQDILCSVINTVSDILSILALMMFILGGTLYAFAHVLPATGNIRANLQGWGLGMLMGGIISLILYIIAPYIVNSLLSISNSGGNPVTGNININQLCGGVGGDSTPNGIPITNDFVTGGGPFGSA